MVLSRITVAGLGALGCAYAAKLHDFNPAGLKVLAGEERRRRYEQEGFIVNGKAYDFNYVSPDEEGECADLLIVAVKTHQLQQVLDDMKLQVGPHTIILSLLNGITSEEIIGRRYGAERVLYAVSYGLTANREGNQIQFPSYGNLAFGEADNRQHSPQVEMVRDLFSQAGIPFSIPENMLYSLWWKFMFNVGINQCSAVTGGRFGLFQKQPEARQLLDDAMREVLALSAAAGVNLQEKDIARWYEILDSLNPDSRTSMLEDMECGRKTEVEAFGSVVCELGQRYGIATPVNRTLVNLIRLKEQQER